MFYFKMNICWLYHTLFALNKNCFDKHLTCFHCLHLVVQIGSLHSVELLFLTLFKLDGVFQPLVHHMESCLHPTPFLSLPAFGVDHMSSFAELRTCQHTAIGDICLLPIFKIPSHTFKILLVQCLWVGGIFHLLCNNSLGPSSNKWAKTC